MHWGTEFQQTPNHRQIQIANHLHALGVQVVIGAHQHVLQGHNYRGELKVQTNPKHQTARRAHIKRLRKLDFTAFGIGNFLFGQHGTPFAVSNERLECLEALI